MSYYAFTSSIPAVAGGLSKAFSLSYSSIASTTVLGDRRRRGQVQSAGQSFIWRHSPSAFSSDPAAAPREF
jgi:hypothetical protein